MKIPMPCAFGESADCKGKRYPFMGFHGFRGAAVSSTPIFSLHPQNGTHVIFIAARSKSSQRLLLSPITY